MPQIEDHAICIRRWDFSETSQTVSLLARSYGIVRGIAKGAKRERGSFSGGIDVLTRGHLGAIVKPGRDLATLTHWHLEDNYPTLRTQLGANRVGWYVADLVHHMLTDHDPHPRVFDAMVATLNMLGERDAGAVLLDFQWMLLRETGYQPQLDVDAQTSRPLDEDTPTLAFSPRAGGVVADTGETDRWRVRRETVIALRGLTSEQEDPTPVPEATVRRANRLLAVYLREIIGREPKAMRWLLEE